VDSDVEVDTSHELFGLFVWDLVFHIHLHVLCRVLCFALALPTGDLQMQIVYTQRSVDEPTLE
jgi:hypothetical protein